MGWPDLPLASGHYVFLLIFLVLLAVPWIVKATKVPELVVLIAGGALIGPSGFGLLERTGTIEVLGTAGLLYLMFQAGLELDPDDFRLNRRPALIFGALTFTAPMVLGFGIHRWLGFEALAALLLASCWASHTLLTYPMFQQARLVSNRAVSIGVAGTVITDTAALLLLVAIVRIHEGALTALELAIQLPLLILAGGLIMIGLPRLTEWVFATIARDRATRFLFTMVALYGSAAFADVVGVEPIIGAFFAGLALHRSVAEGSELAHRIETFGSTLLVPVFLISVGMLIDVVGAATDRRTLALAASFTGVVLVGKSLAAAVTARAVRLESSERAALVALSVPQAAATLAAVFVGFEVGLIDEQVIDAVVIVILTTCLLGSALAAYAVKNLPPPPVRNAPIAKRILMPVPQGGVTPGAIELAAALGKRDTGTVLALSVLDLSAGPADVKIRRAFVTDTVEATALANGCEARSIVRLDLTPGAGIVHAAIEHEATLIIVDWDERRSGSHDRFSSIADTLIDLANVPVLVSRPLDLRRYTRVVIALDETQLATAGMAELVWIVGHRMSQHLSLPLVLETNADDPGVGRTGSVTGNVTEMFVPPPADEGVATSDLVIAPVGEGFDRWAQIYVARPRNKPIDLSPTSKERPAGNRPTVS